MKKPKQPVTTFQMKEVESTRIKAIGYDEKTETCRVEFHKGGSYDYTPFPKQLWLAFDIDKSKGQFFEKYIKGNKSLETKKL